jgi:hypothetical protein
LAAGAAAGEVSVADTDGAEGVAASAVSAAGAGGAEGAGAVSAAAAGEAAASGAGAVSAAGADTAAEAGTEGAEAAGAGAAEGSAAAGDSAPDPAGKPAAGAASAAGSGTGGGGAGGACQNPPSVRARTPAPAAATAAIPAFAAAPIPAQPAILAFPATSDARQGHACLPFASQADYTRAMQAHSREALPMSPIRSICVFCGSRAGADPAHAASARETGAAIAAAGWRLVYGAGDTGLMGEVARAAIAAGGRTLGVIPAHLIAREKGRRDLTQFVVTEDMHERKKVMFMNSDAVVVLPGGAGTLDEFFEVLTWAQIGLHAKPIFLLDTAGYWQPLHRLVEHVVAEGFAERSLTGLYALVPDAAALRAALGLNPAG